MVLLYCCGAAVVVGEAAALISGVHSDLGPVRAGTRWVKRGSTLAAVLQHCC